MTADYKGFKGDFIQEKNKFIRKEFNKKNFISVVDITFVHNDKEHSRQLFMQKHIAKRTTDDKPLGKTLFVVNIPPYINEPQLKSAFGTDESIENIIIEENLDHINENSISDSIHLSNESTYFRKTKQIDGFKVAFIVFKQTKSLEKALRLTKIKMPSNDTTALVTGIDKWMQNYMNSFVDEKLLQTEVDEYMLAFEEKEQEEREEARKTEVDDDGWTVVKRGKVGGGFQQKESVLKALEDKIVQGKKKKEFKNFYAFQIRQSKQRHIVSLRKRFEEDKLKISALKKARRFKPF